MPSQPRYTFGNLAISPTRHQPLESFSIIEVVPSAAISEPPAEHPMRVVQYDPRVAFVGDVSEATLGGAEGEEDVPHVEVLQPR